MPERELTRAAPERIGSDVGNDHRLAPVRRGPAGAGPLVDGEPVDRPVVALGQARGGAVAQIKTTLVEQQDRGERAMPRALLVGACQGLQYRLERSPLGNQLERPLLSRDQDLDLLAIGDVGGEAPAVDELAVLEVDVRADQHRRGWSRPCSAAGLRVGHAARGAAAARGCPSTTSGRRGSPRCDARRTPRAYSRAGRARPGSPREWCRPARPSAGPPRSSPRNP